MIKREQLHPEDESKTRVLKQDGPHESEVSFANLALQKSLDNAAVTDSLQLNDFAGKKKGG